MSKNILVTGSSGLIGGIILKHNSNNNLFGLDVAPSLYPNHEISDISNSKKLENIFLKNNIEVVVHLAGKTSVNGTWNELIGNNFDGTANIFEASKNSGVDKVIFASSNHAVGLFENDNPYKWTTSYVDLRKVANKERMMPRKFISRDGFQITSSCRKYLAPLICGEDYPPYKNGLPISAKLKNIRVRRMLKEKFMIK